MRILVVRCHPLCIDAKINGNLAHVYAHKLGELLEAEPGEESSQTVEHVGEGLVVQLVRLRV